jgi:shikimate dehydrogenase
VSTASSRRNEVWGSPIAHSQSPQLHLAAYAALGVNWEYRRTQVTVEELPTAFGTLDSAVGGLSLTMPLKEGILELVSDHRGPVDLLHAANTVVRENQGWWLDNTDWWGVHQVLTDHEGVDGATVWLLGAGATARSVLYALSYLSPARVVMVVRDPSRARVSAVLADTLLLDYEVRTFGDVEELDAPDWVISTVPGGAVDKPDAFRAAAGVSQYLDAAYDPWPTPLASIWAQEEQPAISGLEMLTNQALAQVRCFVNGDSQTPLADEARVLSQMRQAVGLTPGSGSANAMGE